MCMTLSLSDVMDVLLPILERESIYFQYIVNNYTVRSYIIVIVVTNNVIRRTIKAQITDI